MPILDKIELELNSKINEWINVRNTINRYLQAVEHQVKWKKTYKSKLMLSCFMDLAWHATIWSNWITIRGSFSLFYYNLTKRYERGNHWSWLSLRMSWANLVNWIVFFAICLFIHLFRFSFYGLVLHSGWSFLGFFVLFLILQCLLSINYLLHLVLRCNTPAPLKIKIMK